MRLPTLIAVALLSVAASAAPPDAVSRELSAVEEDWTRPGPGADEVDAVLDRLVALEPRARRHPEFWSLWGRVNLTAGNHRDAALGFSMARRFHFDPERTRTGLARALLEWSHEFPRGPGSPPEPVLRVLLRCREVISEGLAAPDATGELRTLETGCLAALAAARQWSKAFPEAEKLYRELIRRQPEETRYRINLARTYLALKRPQDALVEVQEAIRVRPDPDWMEPVALLGTIQSRLGDESLAEQYYRRFLSVHPDHPVVLKCLADHYFDFERYEAAVEVYLRLVELTPRDHGVYFRLAGALSRLGRREEAEQYMAEFRRLDELRKRPAGEGRGE